MYSPDFAQLSELSPVGSYVGIVGSAAALLVGGTYLVQTDPPPARPPETIAPISVTKPAERETIAPVPETKPVISETRRAAGDVHVNGYFRNGKWIQLWFSEISY